MTKTLNKKIRETDIYDIDTIHINKGWFSRLYKIAQNFENKPTEQNKQMLFGYIKSIKFIINKLKQ